MRLLLAAVFAVIAAPAFAQDIVSPHEMISGAISGFIQPGFHRLATSTASLREDIAAMCATPSEAALGASQAQFKAVVGDYSRVEFVQIGPLSADNRGERLLFWPDRKGIALRQVQQALAAKDQTAGKPETLAKKSVAMQGLGALEYLLFGTGAGELVGAEGAYRCSYASAIAVLLADLTATLDAEWSDPKGVTAALLNPKADAADFRTETEVLEKLAASLIHGTEAIRDQRVLPILGASTGSPKPKSALFWRSNQTIPALASNFAGLAEFFEKARFAEAMGSPTNVWIANGAEFEFAGAQRATDTITSPIEEAVADPVQLKALQHLVIITKALDSLLGRNLSAALGLSVGFSALDGD